jgi:hypothetical protein
MGWKSMASAPTDGTHILACIMGGSWPATTVHWFDGGWHLSVNLYGDNSHYETICGAPTHWMELPSNAASQSA